MSDAGGDMGGGGGDVGSGGGGGGDKGSGQGDTGAANKGGGSGDYNPGPASSDVADYSTGPSPTGASSTGASSSDPSAYSGSSPSNNGSLDSFIANPPGNLAGPGPVSGGDGLPGQGGGSNTPFSYAFDSPINSIDPNSFSGASPVASGSVFDSGASPVTSSAPFDNLVSANSNPGATGAASIAAPPGIPGSGDIASGTNLKSAKPSPDSSGSGTGGSDFLNSIGMGKSNLASAAVGAVGLVNNLVNGNKPLPSSSNLNSNATTANQVAAQQTSAGQALQQWQTTGTLPDSYEQQVQKAAQDAKTRAISNAAGQGLPTDPAQNTALAQQLNAIDAALPYQREQIAAQLAQSGQQMINTGLQATGISSNVYQTLANLEDKQNQAKGAAIANFASALNGGGNKGLTLKVA